MWRMADYQGWSNWETWNTSVMIDNDHKTHDESRKLVEQGATLEEFRDWLIEAVVGPHNRDQIADAKEWNTIPEEERIDHHYEDFVENNPSAKGIADFMGGPDVGDSDPQIIDPELVNWDEIYGHIKDEFESNDEWEQQQKNMAKITPFDHVNYWNDDQVKMEDAWLAHHGVSPSRDFKDPNAYMNHTTLIPIDQLDPNDFSGGTEGQFWQEHVAPHGGYKQRTNELSQQAAHAVQKGTATPEQIQTMQQALQARGHAPEQIPNIMRQTRRYNERLKQWEDIEAQPRPSTNWLDTLEPQTPLDKPGDLTIPEGWGQALSASWKDKYNYRKAEKGGNSCASCSAWKIGPNAEGNGLGRCEMFKATVRADMTCDEWSTDFPSHTSHERVWDPTEEERPTSTTDESRPSGLGVRNSTSPTTPSTNEWNVVDGRLNELSPQSPISSAQTGRTISRSVPPVESPSPWKTSIETERGGSRKSTPDVSSVRMSESVSDDKSFDSESSITTPTERSSVHPVRKSASTASTSTTSTDATANPEIETSTASWRTKDFPKDSKSSAVTATGSSSESRRTADSGLDASGDNWWGPANSTKFEVGMPGSAPGMGDNAILPGSENTLGRQVMYHVTSPERRDSIATQGLIPGYDAGDERSSFGTGFSLVGPAVFLSPTLMDAQQIARTWRKDADIWEVQTQGLDLQKDPSNPDHGYYTPITIGPECLSLMNQKTSADYAPAMPQSDAGEWDHIQPPYDDGYGGRLEHQDNWVWLDGKVGWGGQHHQIARDLAQQLGYDQTQTHYISNLISRNALPENTAVAMGTLNGPYPQIYMSTVDRNAVWDDVNRSRQSKTARD